MYAEDAKYLCLSLMKQHMPNYMDWHFNFDNAKGRAECCHFHTKTITLSRFQVERRAAEDTRYTILHEIAHAIAGHAAGHGQAWREVCIRIGARPERCYSEESDGRTQEDFKFQGECPNCHVVIHRHKRRRIACGKCCSKFNFGRFASQYLFIWKEKYYHN